MDVFDTNERRLVAAARGYARCESGWLAFHIALSAAVVALAVTGLPGVWPAVLWLGAGVVLGDAVTAGRRLADAWREVRVLGRCASCRGTAVELAEGHARRWRCGWSGHGQVSR